MISIVQCAALIASTVAGVALIKAGRSIFAVMLAKSLVYLARYFLLRSYVRRKYSLIDFKAGAARGEIQQSRNVLVHQIAGLVVFNSPVVIITVFCSLKDASVYAVYAMVFTALYNILGSFSNGMQGFFGESLVSESIERTRSIFSRYETLFYAVLGWCYSCAFVLIIPFMQVYTKNMTDANYIQPVLAVLFMVNGVLNALRTPGIILQISAGHYQQTQGRAITETVINIVASVLFVQLLGFYGVLLGNICSSVYRSVDVVVYTNRKILGRNAVRPVVKIAVLATGHVLLVAVIARLVPDFVSGWVTWILYAAAVAAMLAVPAGSCFVCLRNKI